MKKQFSAFGITAIIISAAAFSDPVILTDTTGKTKSEQVQSTGFAFFRTHRQGKAAIVATWGVTSSAGVARFAVQKTYEDPSDPFAYWEDVYSTPCNGARSYKTTDQNVYPGFSSYRVVAQMADGRTVESGVSTVHIVRH